jgi:hypothetical protein
MPILGQGILPSGPAGAELVAVTRRAFIPKVVVQIYQATPLLSALLANAEPIEGGVSPITCPVQGTAMVSTSATDYAGSFTAPTVQTGLQNAEFNLKAIVTPIPFYVMEGLVQIDAAVIPLLEARMNDAGNSITNYLATNLYTQAASLLDIWALPSAVDNANPAIANYGGIDRTVNAWWRANERTIDSIIGAAGPWSRINVLAAIASASAYSGGEMPTFGVCSLGAWTALAADFVSQERYVITPEAAFSEAEEGARALFTALSVGGVPIYADPYMTDGTILYLFNTSYMGFKIHADAAFALAGPESLLPNFQLGYIMVLVALLEFVVTKPKAQSKITGFTGAYTIN